MLSGIALAAEYQATVAVADRTEVRVRSTRPDATSPHFDAATTPSLRLQIGDRRFTYTAGYLPSITLPDIQVQVSSPEVFHVGFLGVAWRVDRRVRVALVQDGSYGQRNFGYLGAAQPAQGQAAAPPLQALPGINTILFGATRTAFQTQLIPARRWGVSTSVAYSLSGGLDADSRTVVPVQRGPRADVSVDYRLTRLDHVSVDVGAGKTDFSSTRCTLDATTSTCSPTIERLDTGAGWTRRLARDQELALAAGVSSLRARDRPTDSYRVHAYPAASATFTDLYRTTGGDHGLVRLGAALAPVIDFRTGQADQRVAGTASVSWARRRTTVRFGANAAQSVPVTDAGAVTLVGGDVELAYRLNVRFDLSTGTRATWQAQPQSPLGSLMTSVSFVALSFHERPLRL